MKLKRKRDGHHVKFLATIFVDWLKSGFRDRFSELDELIPSDIFWPAVGVIYENGKDYRRAHSINPPLLPVWFWGLICGCWICAICISWLCWWLCCRDTCGTCCWDICRCCCIIGLSSLRCNSGSWIRWLVFNWFWNCCPAKDMPRLPACWCWTCDVTTWWDTNPRLSWSWFWLLFCWSSFLTSIIVRRCVSWSFEEVRAWLSMGCSSKVSISSIWIFCGCSCCSEGSS